MIDIEQIELDYGSGYRFSSQSNRCNVIPDLLAEVKRLREGIRAYLYLPMPSRDELKELIE